VALTSMTSSDSLDCACGFSADTKGTLYAVDGRGAYRWAKEGLSGEAIAGVWLRGFNPINRVKYLHGVALDANHNVFFAEGISRVVEWPPGRPHGYVVAGQGPIGKDTHGASLEQLDHPIAVSLDAQGRIYVADAHNHRVVRWPAAPKWVTPPTVPQWGKAKETKTSLSVTWKKPANNGGAPVLKYKIRYYVRGVKPTKVITVVTTKLTFSITKVRDRNFRMFKLSAINRAGESLFLDFALRTS
jgi:hypothetical protein